MTTDSDIIRADVSTDAVPEHPNGNSTIRIRRAGVGAWRALYSFAVWALYVPHVAFVRMLGRRWGRYWINAIATVHWLATFVGANRHALSVMTEVSPELGNGQKPLQMLRKHLAFKHQCFAEQRVFALRAGKNEGTLHDWSIENSDVRDLQELFAEQQGAIVLSYHFGYFRLAAHDAPKIFPSVSFFQLRDPKSPYRRRTHPLISRITGERGREDDRMLGSDVVYLDADVPPIELIHRLRDGQVLLLAADGMSAAKFEDVPFLGGSVRMPIGWAFLAGLTRVPVAVIMDRLADSNRRVVELKKVIRCPSHRPDDVRQAVVEATGVLEGSIRTTPWEWHPWSRMEIHSEQGRRHFVINSDFVATSPSADSSDLKGRREWISHG